MGTQFNWLKVLVPLSPAVVSDEQLRTQYEPLKIRGINNARVVLALKLLTIAFQILRDRRDNEQRSEIREEGASTIISVVLYFYLDGGKCDVAGIATSSLTDPVELAQFG